MMIDFNADMGEIESSWLSGRDQQLLRYLDSVNISCGFHAGSDWLIEATLKEAQNLGIKIGAHPGYTDRANFGRKPVSLNPDITAGIVDHQLSYFFQITSRLNVKVHHVKAHGAFYNQLVEDYKSSVAFCEAIKRFDNKLVIYGLPDSETAKAAKSCGMRFCNEGFADRLYTDAGKLMPRSEPDALIQNTEASVQQVVNFTKGYVLSHSGKKIPIKIDTVCVHGDTPNALDLVQTIRILS
jgi:UPF0271 protein